MLSRLVRDRLVATLERRIGGIRAGSTGLIYTLDVAGQRVLQLLDTGQETAHVRRPWTPGLPFVAHTLAISELYVQLREVERDQDIELVTFLAEPACWQRTLTSGVLKPDAYTMLARDDIEDCWNIESDLGTESRSAVRRKLTGYLQAAHTGQVGPHGVLPRVLVTVPDARRLAVVQDLISALPPPADTLLHVTLHEQAVEYLVHILRQ